MKKQIFWTNLLLSGAVVLLSGCLMTRDEIADEEHRKNVQQQVTTLQKNTADSQNRYSEINEELRDLHGKVEAQENAIRVEKKDREKSQSLADQQLAETNKRVLLLQEEVQKLETQVSFLNQELVKVASNQSSSSSGGEKGKSDKSANYYKLGEDSFNKKEWKESIVNFQKYRDSHPSGKSYAMATFKIGSAFRELGMKDEARTFFEEVVTKYPDTLLGKKSKELLKKK